MPNICVQNVSEADHLPSEQQLQHWCESALLQDHKDASLAIRIVDEQEMLDLNSQYRRQNKTTNVLSFPCDLPSDLPAELQQMELGDIVVCAQVVAAEAQTQNKTLDAHWAHMIVHGSLHLQGYDHGDEQEAQIMEALEIKIMNALGFPSPYSH